MYLMFLENNNEIKTLFAYSDKDVCLHHCISIDVLRDLLKTLLPETAKVKKLYAGSYSFKDASWGTFYALVRIVNNSADEVLRIADNNYDVCDMCKLLSEENKVEGREYKVFEFSGTLRE